MSSSVSPSAHREPDGPCACGAAGSPGISRCLLTCPRRPEQTAAEVASMTAYTGLVIQPYRTDDSRPAWVFRCWGTDDDCDGYLSLDHGSAQSAARALTRHVEECHTTGAPQPEVTIRIRDGLTEQQRAEVRQIIEEYARRAEREGRVSR